jgi:hypothetical protein
LAENERKSSWFDSEGQRDSGDVKPFKDIRSQPRGLTQVAFPPTIALGTASRPLTSGNVSMNRSLPLICAWLLLLFVGCASAYDADFQSASQQATESQKFEQLTEARFQLGQMPASVRLPKQLPETYIRPSSTDPLTIQPRLDPLRAIPPYLNSFAQSHIATFEVWNQAEDGKLPIYVAFWTPPSTSRGKGIVDRLKDSLQKDFPAGQNFEDVAARTPDGATIQWKRFKGTATTPYFRLTPEGQLVQKPLKENLDLWVYTPPDGANQGAVVMAWRIPQELESLANFEELAQLVAGSLTSS